MSMGFTPLGGAAEVARIAQAGSVLSVVLPPSWTGATYQWTRNGADIAGATGATHDTQGVGGLYGCKTTPSGYYAAPRPVEGFFEPRPLPVFEEHVVADLSARAKIFNNAAAGYNNVSDVSGVARTAAPNNVHQYYLPATLGPAVDVSTGNWNVVFEWRPVSNAGAKQTSSSWLDRFNIVLSDSAVAGTIGPNIRQLGEGSVDALRAFSTSVDHATPGRWQRFSAPLSMLSSGGSPITLIRNAQVHLRAAGGLNVGIELGRVILQRNPRTRGAVIFFADDLFASHYTRLFPDAQARGVPHTLYPGAYLSDPDSPGRMTKAQIGEVIAAGWQLANQAPETESLPILAAQSSATRLANLDAVLLDQRSRWPANRDGWRWGSYFSTFNPYNIGPVSDDFFSRFDFMRRFDGGNDANPPLPWGETFPEGDPLNVRALNVASVSQTRIIQALEFAALHKGVIYIGGHQEADNPSGAAYLSWLAAMDWVAANPSLIEATTPMGLWFPEGA